MADQKKTAAADYEVGFGHPPKRTQFRQGRSGNPRGRPRRVKHDAVDIAALLSEPIAVKKGGVSREMSSFEVSLHSLARRAIMDGKLDAILEFLKLCEQYRIIELARAPAITGALFVIPRTWDREEWKEMFDRFGPPPWKGKRSGLPGDPPKES